jgi:hypothetical protein
MSRKYRLEHFAGTTWEEFLKCGAKINGFGEREKISAANHPERLSPLLPDRHFKICRHERESFMPLRDPVEKKHLCAQSRANLLELEYEI